MKILIIQTAFIGDVVISTSFIRAVKEVFPDSQVDFILSKANEQILSNNPKIKNVFTFNKKRNKLLSFFKTVRQTRKRKYAITFLLHSSTTSALIAFLAGAKVRVGFDRNLSKYLLTHRVRFDNKKRRVKKNIDLLKPFSKKKFSIQTELFPSDADYKITNRLLLAVKQKRYVCFAPGSVWATKMWGADKFAKLARQIVKLGFAVVLVGSKSEKVVSKKIVGDGIYNFMGKSSILQAACLIENADSIFCNDSGLMHIANAVGTKVYAFFGPTVQEHGYFPFGRDDLVFQKKISCRPCGKHGSQKCKLGHHNCMRKISVDEVFEKFVQGVNK